MRRVYVCHPFADDPVANQIFVKGFCEDLAGRGVIPVAPHIYLPHFLNEVTQRELAMQMCLGLLEVCDELAICSEKISSGMEREIKHANAHGIWVSLIADVVKDGPPLHGTDHTSRPRRSARSHAKNRGLLHGADAQALEGAISVTEWERDQARDEAAALRLEVEKLTNEPPSPAPRPWKKVVAEDGVTKAISKGLLSAGGDGLHLAAILRLFSGHTSKSAIDDALSWLEENGYAKCEEDKPKIVRGKTATIWYATSLAFERAKP